MTGNEINEAIWDYLVDMDVVADCIDGYHSLRDFSYDYGSLLQLVSRALEYDTMEKRSRDLSREGPESESQAFESANTEAVTWRRPSERHESCNLGSYYDDLTLKSLVIGNHASELLHVKQWRREHLAEDDGYLVLPDEVTLWVKMAGERDWKGHGQEEIAARFCEDEGYQNQVLMEAGWDIDRWDWIDCRPTRSLLCPNGGCSQPYFISWRQGEDRLFMQIPADGSLILLKQLAVALVREYRVREYEAVHFILTGQPMRYHQGEYRVFDVFGRTDWHCVCLLIDPSMSENQVAFLYREAREHLPTQRKRPLDRKTHLLVERCYDQMGLPSSERNTRQAWRELLLAWNEAFPEWRFQDERDLRRTYNRALRKLLPPKLHPSVWAAPQ